MPKKKVCCVCVCVCSVWERDLFQITGVVAAATGKEEPGYAVDWDRASRNSSSLGLVPPPGSVGVSQEARNKSLLGTNSGGNTYPSPPIMAIQCLG